MDIHSTPTTFNPVQDFALEPDQCMTFFLDVTKTTYIGMDLYVQLKATALEVAKLKTPTIHDLVEAWRKEFHLVNFANLVANVMLPK